ncbi:MAG TPA: DUF222 domain-containing protein [Candidatus Dormibacteraeota bacterium]
MLATQDVYSPSPNDLLRERLFQRRRVIDLQEIAFAREAAEFAAGDAWDEDGSVSAIDWLRFHCHMNAGAAANSIAVGELLERIPESHQAVVDGEIGFAHLATMARTAEALGDRFDEKVLVEKAKESSPGKFFYICHHARHAADPKAYAAEQAEQVEQRRLKLSKWMDGSVLISGQLDPIGGAAVLTVLEPLARKSGPDDERCLERRNADALVELASGGGSQAQIQVTSSLETLLALAGAPAAEMEHCLPVSSKTIERLGCDSSIARVLLNSESLVIDVGRSKRVVSEPGRRALTARDGHCTWRECDRPASRSAAHHLVHWLHGGTSDLDNLILLCHRHHWMVHEGGWQIVRGENGKIVTIPPTVNFGPSLRGPD